jgi:HK97 gp10 family phage protein
MAKVTFKDHSDIILRKMAGNIGSAASGLSDVALEAIQNKMLYGYYRPILQTGALFDSVSAQVKRVSQNGFTVEAGAGMPYAKYVHDGTRKMTARPFITDGLTEATPEIRQALSKDLSKGF